MPTDLIVRELQRRAANELFEWLGCSLIPPQYWEFLDRVADPGEAIEQLLLALGCDSKRARRRDPSEIARINVAIDLLIELETLRAHLSSEHLRQIEYLLFTGDYETVKQFSRIISALVNITVGKDRSKGLRVFAVYSSFLSEVERYLSDPLHLEPADAEQALHISDRLLDAMEKYSPLHLHISECIGATLSMWPTDLESGHDCDLRDGMTLRFEEIDNSLLNDAVLGLSQIETLLQECSLLRDDLARLFERVCGGPGTEGPTALDPVDEALVFFGFAAGSKPTMAEVQSAYRSFMKKVHPDHATDADPSERLRRDELAKEANQHRDRLRREFKRAP